MTPFISPTEASTEYAPSLIATAAVCPFPSIGKNSIDPSLTGFPSRVTVPWTLATGDPPQPPDRNATPTRIAGRSPAGRSRLIVATDDLPAVRGSHRLPRDQVDRIADESDRPIAHRCIHTPGVPAPGRQVLIDHSQTRHGRVVLR